MLTYGLKRGTKDVLLHIDRVPNGSKCGCVCPHCGEDLEACQGEIRQHFFRHASGTECKGARMTVLHMLAQNILKREKQVMLPEYRGNYYQEAARLVEFDDVELEQVCKDERIRRRPDCIGYKGNKKGNIWIEIYCTHPIDEKKKADIIERKQACIEIDFSELLNTTYTEEIVKERLLDAAYGHWIYSPKCEKSEAEGRAKAEAERLERERLETERRIREIKLARDEQKRINYYEYLVSTWKKSSDKISTDNIIKEIKKKPYLAEDEEDIIMRDILVPSNRWAQAFQTFPRNEEGLRVFYALLRYYYKSIKLDDRSHKRWKVIDTPMWNLLNQNGRTVGDNVYLEYLIILWAINLLNNHWRYCDRSSELPKIFAQNENVRKGLMEIMLQGGDRSRFHQEDVQSSIKTYFENKEDGGTIIQIFEVCFPTETSKDRQRKEKVTIEKLKPKADLDPYGFEKEWGRIHGISLKEACELTNKAFEEQDKNKTQ